MPVTALLADDEPHLLRHLEGQLKPLWPELTVVARARNGVEAAAQIAELQPDVAFLDIKMPGLTGLEVAQGIEGRTRVVFVTAFDEFAVQAFEQAAVDYLLKPVQADRLRQTVTRLQGSMAAGAGLKDDAKADPDPDTDNALARTLQRLLGQPGLAAGPRLRFVRASQGDLTVQIPVDEVLCFHADDKYTVVHTALREHLIRMPIAELATQLDPEAFWQIHRSTVVNVRSVHSTRRDELSRLYLRLSGIDREWPVSRAYVHLFKAM